MHIPQVLVRFLVGYLILQLILAGLFVFLLSRTIRDQVVTQVRTQLETVALVLQQKLEDTDGHGGQNLAADFKEIGRGTDLRFTLIDSEGLPITDSLPGIEAPETYNNRTEVNKARSDGSGFAERNSATTKKPMLYQAIAISSKNNDGNANQIVRVAQSAVGIDNTISSLRKYVWLFSLLSGLVTCLMMVAVASHFMAPLAEFAETARQVGKGQYDSVPAMYTRRDEWRSLADAFRHMQIELSNREQSIVENSAKTEVVLSSMKEGVIAIDPAGDVILVNRAAGKILELRPSELMNRKLLDIVRAPQFGEAIQKTLDELSFYKTEFETSARPRKILNARIAAMTTENEDEQMEPLGATIVLSDVTELRQLENMRRDFVANVSHELKTPLASIKAYAETLLLGAIHDESKNILFIKQIESQADMLNRQIQDLLQLARVESGKQHFAIVTIPINKICSQCLLQFETEASYRQVAIIANLDSNEPQIIADKDGVTTILNNLVSNAIHYTPEGGEVTIETSTEGSDVIIRVSDTGIGIAPEHRGRIFERFYRVDKARSRDLGGTGLGLAIVKHLTQSFDGSIEVESEIGIGSTFTVRFPLAKS